ncbi:prolyl-tRNA synthetase class IIa archaeal-type [Fadolivirus algeromassiliense]|jgi:prolyl-tRNA synthetase|uniref:Proline--tRNA ligase n=1 Tax=Fadolivirus FV1/VV64 TaxID=3070911 RepID=A0A7D3QU08_9VIRU|nr:prolyl-tRNA synthetase class IIa archaeal-type [Fadolivirus algeromassiliense]QKF93763.1 prolyl-tRNA synthetase class IIa archaeal-type [Fadolivirus FV1/VV64]
MATTSAPKYDMEHEMGITVKKSENFGEWYKQVLTKGKFIEYYDISGCYVLLPNSYSIWENVQQYIDRELKKIGVKNAYFPLFISEKNLSREKDHLEGFTPEVAWVTKAGDSELQEKIAVRPTSECAMYPIFSNLIRSHTDLPLKMNQWCSVVRWEFKDCTPFIRSREFCWSETHHCYASEASAMEDVLKVLDLYKKTYNDLLAIPVIRGRKTEGEKFAGADSTYTIEGYIPTVGKGIQAATSHSLGQHFSKMFDIKFQDTDTVQKYVWQISCGITTRSLGIMLMNHGDDKGAIIPPYVADVQIVIIPITMKKRHDDIIQKCKELTETLSNSGFRVKLDDSNHNPGWKFNYWETIGVPLRIEIGPKDVDKNVITVCKRTDFKKSVVENNATITMQIKTLLDEIHNDLYNKANNELISHIRTPINSTEFGNYLDEKNLCLIRWCGTDDCEKQIKEDHKAKSLCIPMDLSIEVNGDKCTMCGKDSNMSVLFGRSY